MKNTITFFEVSSDASFTSFYNTYYKRFVRYAFYYVSDRKTAEDITHDAILYYLENQKKISAEIDILGYLLTTIKNKCLNYLKHLQIEVEYNKNYIQLYEWEIKARIMTLENENYEKIFTKDIMDIITNSLTKLPAQTQKIFIEHRFNYKSRKDIATELGVSLQKIDFHINKANKHLYDDLKDYLPVFLLLLCS